MLVNDIKDGNKKILIIGINSLSVSLSKILVNYNNIVTFFEKNNILSMIYKQTIDKTLDIVNSLEYDFNSFDYIIVGKKLNSGDFETDNLMKIINKLSDKVYIISEIIYILYPDKYFIHIIDETHRDLVYSELDYIYKENSVNTIRLPFFDNEDEEQLKNIDISDIDIFMVGDCNKEFLKDLNFNIIGFFDLQDKYIDDYTKNLFLKQSQTSKSFINTDNEYLKEFHKNIQENSKLSSKIISISTKKLIENGYSYINDTIYCYIDSNDSYDLVENDYIVSNISKVSTLASFAIATNTGQTIDTTMECLKNFRGTTNIIEYINKVNNIRFINNIWATTNDILVSPFETYNNIYVIFVTNGKQSNFFRIKNYTKNMKKIFLVDMFDCINLSDNEKKINIRKYKNIDEAFKEVIANIKDDINNHEPEEVTVLLSPIIDDKMNSVYYKDYGIKFKQLIEGL